MTVLLTCVWPLVGAIKPSKNVYHEINFFVINELERPKSRKPKDQETKSIIYSNV